MANTMKTSLKITSDVKNADGTRDRTYDVIDASNGNVIGTIDERFSSHAMDYKTNRIALSGTCNGKKIDGARTRALTVRNVRNAYVNGK